MGAWRRAEIPWHETRIMSCSLCGKMIPRQAWVALYDGAERLFCGPACERLFLSYWLPRYGNHRSPGPLDVPAPTALR